MLKKVKIALTAERYGVAADLFEEFINVMESGELMAALTEPAADADGNNVADARDAVQILRFVSGRTSVVR